MSRSYSPGNSQTQQPRMEPSFFKDANDVRVAGDVTSETIDGDYFDETHTTIKEKRVGRQIYHQEGSVGVLNDDAKFTGTLNYGVGPPGTHPRQSDRRPMRGEHRRQKHGDRTWTEGSAGEGAYDRTTRSHAPERPPDRGAPSFFQGASNVSIGGNVSSRTVNGNVYARGSKTITRENVPVKEYHQQGSVGVVNGNGDFSGVLNHGGNGEWTTETGGRRRQTHYPDSDETSSEDDHFDRRYRDQRGAVGVINDHGSFSGTLNYNVPPSIQPWGQRQDYGGDEYGVPPDGQERPARRGEQPTAYHGRPPSELDHDAPNIDVRPSSPIQSVAEDIYGMYNGPAYPTRPAHQYGYGAAYSTGLQPPPRDHRGYRQQGYNDRRYPLSPSPRMAASSQHPGYRQSQYPPTPRSPGPPPEYSGPSRGFGGGHQQWGPPGGTTPERYGTSTGLTDGVAGMYVTTDPRASYPSPPRSGHGHYPQEKGGYFN